MFVVINVKESGKRRIRKGRTVDKIREISTCGGEKFYIADVFDSETGVNWDETAAFLGRHSKNALLDRRINLSDICPVKRFCAEKYRNILIFNTAELIFRQMYLAGCRTECVIYDPDGKYAFLLEKAAKFSARTTVVTDREYMYYPVVSSLYTRMGAGITVTDNHGALKTDAIIIDTHGSLDICSDTMFSVCNNGITPKYTEGMNELKALCPVYIDTIDFLGAVYQFNKDKRTDNSLVRIFRRNDEDISVSALTEELINMSAEDCGRLLFSKKL